MPETTPTSPRQALLASVGAPDPGDGYHFVITRRGKLRVPIERPATGPIPWAANLVRALEETGTGASVLEVIERAMLRRFGDPEHAAKPADHADRHLTSAEAIAEMERANLDPFTVRKARLLAETGAYKRPETRFQVDALPPPPDGPAPDRLGKAKVEPDSDPQPEPIAGVRNLAGGVDTVGLLPAPPAAPAPAPPAKGIRNGKDKPGEAK